MLNYEITSTYKMTYNFLFDCEGYETNWRHAKWKGLSKSLQSVFTYSGLWDNILKNSRCIIGIRNFKY